MTVGTLVQARNLAMALKSYQLDYGKLPPVPSVEKAEADKEAANAEILAVLQANAAAGNADHALNPRKVKYFEAQAKFIKEGSLVDAWGHPFHVLLDLDYDGAVTVGTEKVASPVAVWSDGPNGKDEKGAGDDVASWK